MARFPFGIPNSWYLVAYSDEIDGDTLRPLPYLGRNMLALRGPDGAVSVLDGYCPHLGADLSAGGTCTGRCEGQCEYQAPEGGCEASASAKCEAAADASIECDAGCEGSAEPPSVSAECEATVEAKADASLECLIRTKGRNVIAIHGLD